MGCSEKGITAGVELTDTVHALWPFTSSDLGLTGITSDGLTHAEAVCYFQHDTAPYKYIGPHKYIGPAGGRHRFTLVRWEWVLIIALIIGVVGGGIGALVCNKKAGMQRGDTEADNVQLTP